MTMTKNDTINNFQITKTLFSAI